MTKDMIESFNWFLPPLVIFAIFYGSNLVCLNIVLKRRFKFEIDKLVWTIVLIFLPIIGTIFFVIHGLKNSND